MNKNRFRVFIVAAFLAATATGAMARGGGGGHADGGQRGHSADMGFPNTNRQSLPSSERGLERAGERMNEEGLDHSNAFDRHEELETQRNIHKEHGRERHLKRKPR